MTIRKANKTIYCYNKYLVYYKYLGIILMILWFYLLKKILVSLVCNQP